MPLIAEQYTTMWTAIAAVAAAFTALVTTIYTYLTLRLVRAQADPNVILYVRHDPNRPSILAIVIENIGRDIAHDVKFVPSRPIPERAFGIEQPTNLQPQYMQTGPLIEGIPSFGPGDVRVITWGQFGGLSAALGNEPIKIVYTFKHGRRVHVKEARLEVQSYFSTDASEPPLVNLAKSVASIRKALTSAARDLHVIVVSQNGKKPNSTGSQT